MTTVGSSRRSSVGWGGVIGGVIAHKTYYPRGSTRCSGGGFGFSSSSGPAEYSRAETTAAGAAGGVLFGGYLGYLAGKARGGWETVEPDQLAVDNGRISLSLSIRR
ncbi:MAG TPA: hypothetical protein EYQ64_15325 [Gemmatimonadetes bacterium]|nr:hypothetical protein [Gemmatimonadota bacterium]